MRKIFISYRRSDSADITDRIMDRLKKRLGNHVVFRDVEAIIIGDDFLEVIKKAINECDVVLVVIGKHWICSKNESGHSQLEGSNDYVRLEILTAINQNKRIIPILVNNIDFPNVNDLPDELRVLVKFNGARIRHDPDFDVDIDRLISKLKYIYAADNITTKVMILSSILIVAICLLLYCYINGTCSSKLQPKDNDCEKITFTDSNGITYKTCR